MSSPVLRTALLPTPTSRLVALALTVLSALLLGACGSSDSDVSSSPGGSATLSQRSQPDFLDPALSYTVGGWEAMWLVYTPLLTYAHEEGPAGAELIPGLAEDLPEVSADGSTYTLRLRDGLTYSDGTKVVAGDFEHTIKRVLNLGSGGAYLFEGIVGAKDYESQDDPEADISGIETDDKTGEISIELEGPDATFSNALATNFAGIVPAGTEFDNLSESPPPGVGPYVITESVPNREFVMERRKDFAELGIPGIPAGYIDTLTTEIIKSGSQQTQDVLDNEIDYMVETPVADMKPAVLEEVGPETDDQRYDEFATPSTYYFFLNLQEEPFDDPGVREAVNIGVDKPALARLYAGELAPGCSFVPPGMPGYDEALDIEECPWGNPNEAPDVEAARQMIEDAGATGAEVTVWGISQEPTSTVTQAYAEQLNEIGLDATPKLLNGGVYYQTVEDQSTRAQTGFTNWFSDFPHPLSFYQLVDGDSIQPQNNQNIGNIDDPKINDEIDALRRETDLPSVTDRWEELDRYLVENAYLLPFGHRKSTTFVSDRIEFESIVVHPLYYNDYSSFQLTDGE